MSNAQYTGVKSGRKTVTAAGTAEALSATHQGCQKIEVTALLENTDVVVVGGTDVVAAVGTRKGTPLLAGATFTMYISALEKVYIDSVVSGEGVSFTYFE